MYQPCCSWELKYYRSILLSDTHSGCSDRPLCRDSDREEPPDATWLRAPLDQTSPGTAEHLSEQRLTPLMEQMGHERNRTAVGGGSAGRSLLVYGITRIINEWIQQEPFIATKISLSPSFDKTPSAQTEALSVIKSISPDGPPVARPGMKSAWVFMRFKIKKLFV